MKRTKRKFLMGGGITLVVLFLFCACPQQITEGASGSGGTTTLDEKLLYGEADFFGRAPIDKVEGFTNNGDKAALTAMLNNRGKDSTLTFKPTDDMRTHINAVPTPAANNPTWFIIDLKKEYDVSLIKATFDNNIMVSFESDQTNAKKIANFIKIELSTSPNAENDPAAQWVTVADKASLRSERGYIRYEFASRRARYVRLTFWQYSGKAQGSLGDWSAANFIDHGNITVKECTVCADTAKTPKPQHNPGGTGSPHQLANFGDLHRSQQIVIDRGFPLLGWVPSDNYARGPLIPDGFEYSGPLFYDKSVTEDGKNWIKNVDYLKYRPDALWGIAKAPAGQNGAGGMFTYDFIHSDLKPFVKNAVDFCFGDEGRWSSSEEAQFATWFAWSKANYPAVLVHSNQSPGQWQKRQVQSYVAAAQPDMLTWDNYYPELSRNDDKQKNAVIYLLAQSAWIKQWLIYRELALKGEDGTGAKPFIFGQYLDTYWQDQPESIKNLIANLSIASGAKWLNFFRLDTQFDLGLLWDKNGVPSAHLKEWNAVVHNIRGIEKQILRLTNDYLAVKTGTLSSNAGQLNGEWAVSTFENATAKNTEYGIKTVSVESMSSAHGGGTGDVVLGYFKKLPGINGSEITAHFAGATDPKCFMVLNGLIAGRAAEYPGFNYGAKESGRCENTKQKITLTFESTHPAKLMRVNKKNGTVEDITSSIQKVGSDDTLEIILGGGLCELYFWKD